MIKRRITGIVLAVLWFFFWIYQGWPLRIVFTLLMGIGMLEMCRAFDSGKGVGGEVGCIVFTLLALPVYEFALKFGGANEGIESILCKIYAIA